MTYIKNNKALVFIIAILLLSNIALVYFFVKKDGKKSEQKEFGSFREYMAHTLKTEVGFSDEQVKNYEELSVKHKQSMRPLFNDIHATKENFYRLLSEESGDSLRTQRLHLIGEKQELIDSTIFNHFQSLRQICTQDQLPKYDTVIQRVVRGMIGPKKGNDKKK
jgi:periplasmic protein CpxP/Spy